MLKISPEMVCFCDLEANKIICTTPATSPVSTFFHHPTLDARGAPAPGICASKGPASVRARHEYSFAEGSGDIKERKCSKGTFVRNFSKHGAISDER
ncbi:hypothetical protein K438DRAFT_1967076 [Mycena galopus ATCC 62051]|nr:hypothetical protein K438DRAFT_1967076 [Mycena galopus ATCC 62051]